jgi:hypothetical protein
MYVIERVRIYLILVVSVSTGMNSHAETLSEEALFIRCFSHLTQTRPTDTFSMNLLTEIRAGTKSAVNACMEVLDGAALDSDTGMIMDAEGQVGKNVLRIFYDFHRSWFMFDEWNSMAFRDGVDEDMAVFNQSLAHA